MRKTAFDCRGLACPQPVLQAKEALDGLQEGTVELLVDNEAARSNLARFAKSQGYAVEIRSKDGEHLVLIGKGSGEGREPVAFELEAYQCAPADTSIVYLIQADTLGRGDEALGRVLMRAFVKTIASCSPLPDKIFFYNSGVRLTCGESELIGTLEELMAMGVAIYSCGTCLDFFHLTDARRVGEVTNMFEIVDSMLRATKCISPA